MFIRKVCLHYLYSFLFKTLAPSVGLPSGLNLVVAAVLRDSLCVVSLLSCVADCCMLYIVCKVERFVLTIIKQKIIIIIVIRLALLTVVWCAGDVRVWLKKSYTIILM